MNHATKRGLFALAAMIAILISNAFTQDANNARAPHKETQLFRAHELARVLRATPQSATLAKAPLPKGVRSGGADPAIAGAVTSSDGTALANALIIAFTTDSSTTPWKGYAYSQADGSYLIAPLVAGQYYVYAEAPGYVQQFFDRAASYSDAKLVQVHDADTTAGINFALEKNLPGTGAISGSVTEGTGALPIGNATISVYSYDHAMYYGSAQSQRDGTYRVENLKAGKYLVQVWAEGFIAQYYDNARSAAQATVVAVEEPLETTGISFALNRGGSIIGKVTNDTGVPLQGAIIEAVSVAKDSITMGGRGFAVSDFDGTYKISGLESSEYLALAQAWNQWSFDVEWYKETDDPTLATALTVAEGEVLREIDFTLDLVKPAGAIAGRVTNANGEPLANAVVQTQNWIAPGDSLKPVYWGYAYTDAAGDYRIEMPAGEYWAAAYAFSSWQYAVQWYDHVSTQDSARTLVIAQGVHHANVDFMLPLVTGQSVIAGRIVSHEGAPLPYAFVRLTSDNTGNPALSVWAYANADSNGDYVITQLPAGNYIAQAQAWQYDKYGQQWYQNADSLKDAKVIALGEAQKITDIDFSLKLRPIYGKLFGQVASDSGGAPITRAYVELTPLNRDYVREAPFAFWGWNTITDDKGEFRFEWLPEGEYLISVHAQGAFEYYENAAVAELATPIKVAGGDSLQINFGLTPRNEGNGAITGRVVQEYSNEPLPIALVLARPVVTVQVWPQSEMFFTAVTSVDGYYKLTGLPPGEYYVMSFAPYASPEYFDNVFDPSQATAVKVDGQGATENINFTLFPWGILKNADPRGDFNSASVFGKVTDRNGNAVSGAFVYVLNESRQPLASAKTNAEGMYEITSLAAGKYRMLASHLAFEGKYNDNANDFTSAEPVELGREKVQVDFVLAPKGTTGVDEQPHAESPQAFELYANYPNPFNPVTSVQFAVSSEQFVSLKVYDVRGNEVATLVHEKKPAGIHRVRFEAGRFASGIYFIKLRAGTFVATRKMALVR